MLASAHTLAELYPVLTVLSSEPRIRAEAAEPMIRHNVDGKIVPLEAKDYRLVVARLAAARLRGGILYDALIARCAEKAGADLLLTLNPRPCRRVWPEGDDRITSP
ncbi:MAG TPA: PIN domain-containing protein [Thermoanaerobaculia bacterium]|nr:PIN domain-containing protein [Thermoanaerobaculia bacterium]